MNKFRITLAVDTTMTRTELAEYFSIPESEVTQQHAQDYAENWQEDIAGSNDGSEMLANADIKIEAIE